MDGKGWRRVATQAAAARASGETETNAGAIAIRAPPHDTDRWFGRERERQTEE